MRVVVIGAGLGGLSAAAHLVGAGHDVHGRRARRASRRTGRRDRARRLPARHRADRAHDARAARRHVRRRRRRHGRPRRRCGPVDPMYRAVVRRRLGAPRPPRPRGDDRGDPGRSPAPDAAASFGRFADWLDRAVRGRDAELHRRQLRLGARPRRAAGGPALRLVRLGGFGKLDRKVASFFDDERLQRIFSFQAMYAGVAPHEALALYSVITYMDPIEGVYVPVGGDARHGHRAGRRRRQGRGDVPLRGAGDAHPPRRRRRGHAASSSAAASASTPTSSCATPTCPSPTARCSAASTPRASPAAVTYSPSCLLWVAGVRGAPPAERRPPQHPLRRPVGRVVRRAHPPRRRG